MGNARVYRELASLFFATRQIIRQRVPGGGAHDPNAWLRLETLRFIDEKKEPTMRDVARYVRITAPSATSLVGNLERRGLVRKKNIVSDRRVVRIATTAKGKRALKRYEKHSAAIMRSVFGKLRLKDVETLRAILKQLARIHGYP